MKSLIQVYLIGISVLQSVHICIWLELLLKLTLILIALNKIQIISLCTQVCLTLNIYLVLIIIKSNIIFLEEVSKHKKSLTWSIYSDLRRFNTYLALKNWPEEPLILEEVLTKMCFKWLHQWQLLSCKLVQPTHAELKQLPRKIFRFRNHRTMTSMWIYLAAIHMTKLVKIIINPQQWLTKTSTSDLFLIL